MKIASALFLLMFANLSFASSVNTTYWPNGAIRDQEPLKDGVRHGLAEYRWDNGQLYGHINWVEGKKDGEVILYRKDGSIEQKNSFKDGIRHGIFEWYDSSGVKTSSEIYENGNLVPTMAADQSVATKEVRPKKNEFLGEAIYQAFYEQDRKSILFLSVLGIIVSFMIAGFVRTFKNLKGASNSAIQTLKMNKERPIAISQFGPRAIVSMPNPKTPGLELKLVKWALVLSVLTTAGVLFFAVPQMELRVVILATEALSVILILKFLPKLLKAQRDRDKEILASGAASIGVISSINQRHYVVTFFVNSEIREVIVRKTNALKERAQLGRLKELDLVTVVYKKDDPNQAVIYELSEQKVA